MHPYGGHREGAEAGSPGKRGLTAVASPRQVLRRKNHPASQVLVWGALIVSCLFVLVQLWLAGQLHISLGLAPMQADSTEGNAAAVKSTPSKRRGNIDDRGTNTENNDRMSSEDAAAAAKSPPLENWPSTRWLQGSRIGNEDRHLTKTDVRTLIAVGAKGPFANLIGETVCAEESPLATSPDLTFTGGFADWNRETASQIIFRALHENQYGHARAEALSRLEDWETWEATLFNSSLQKHEGGNVTTLHPVGLFDFECRDAKFLVAEGRFRMDVGLGSNLRRWSNTPAMYYGLAYQRIVLFPKGDKDMALASCDRRDLQCSFLPLSPCVITREELENAPRVKGDMDQFFKKHGNEMRVVKFNGERSLVKGCTEKYKGFTGTDKDLCTPELLEKYRKREPDIIGGIQKTIVELYSAQERNLLKGRKEVFSKAVREIVAKEFNGVEPMLNIETAAQLFIVRPNRAMREAITKAMQESFPRSYDPSKAIGLPIRASDKCILEQRCPEFGKYMDQVKALYPLDQIRHVVLTSEDEKVLRARHGYTSEGEGRSSGLEFIVNQDDVTQGSGMYRKMTRKVTTDEVMASTMTAWAFQLRVGRAFLNRCSNFHRLIEATMDLGCSTATAIHAQDVHCNQRVV